MKRLKRPGTKRITSLFVVLVVSCVAVFSQKAARPGPRTAHSLVYDAQKRSVVLLGGYRAPNQPEQEEVWSWSGKRWQPIRVPGPAARSLGGAVYDSRRKRIVLFGGSRGPQSMFGDTWEWDGKAWRKMAETGAGPRDHHAMAFDEGRGRAVMFGGGRDWPDDTWEWDGLKWIGAATTGPGGRGRTSMVYDSTREQVILFGGLGGRPGRGQPQVLYNDIWGWNGKMWQKLGDGGPPARYAHAMSFDSQKGVLLLYGGATMTEQFEDMWQWDGKQWIEIKMTGPTPGKRYSPAMVFDRKRHKTILYGGMDTKTGKVFDDTWEWDGKKWTQVDISPEN